VIRGESFCWEKKENGLERKKGLDGSTDLWKDKWGRKTNGKNPKGQQGKKGKTGGDSIPTRGEGLRGGLKFQGAGEVVKKRKEKTKLERPVRGENLIQRERGL